MNRKLIKRTKIKKSKKAQEKRKFLTANCVTLYEYILKYRQFLNLLICIYFSI